ncbi:hypothetical protein SAMN05421830_105174 [Desulfomicrobium norvegicum]|uniref:Tle cognate immunity protein 4 C-terminal domain-containing protein n=2 Tax=Desulfomicrobium norvegicum (strain DSM 1741 / NCIMB 8310) TaxID=52561 RepID=A0A8G2F613_DESNO|nr:hypothetical protein SAMN05421830_105174 [Desulfomicrobium norvegicum]
MRPPPFPSLSILLLTLILGGCHYMTIDTAGPNPNLPPCPVTMFPVGRFMVPVPKDMKLGAGIHNVNKITIEEIAWKKGRDREEYLKEVWMLVRTEAWERYIEGGKLGPSNQGGWAEEDVSHLFGYPAMLFCYRSKTADHNIDVHIGLPEAILRLTESRFYPIGNACLDMEERILNLFKHYRFGNKNVAPDSFFSAGGRVEGLKTWHERASLGATWPAGASRPTIRLSFHTSPSCTDEFPKNVFTGSAVARKHGIRLHVLRSQKRTLAGMVGLEEVYLIGNKDDDELRLSASWKYPGSGKDPEKPDIELKITCPESAKEKALHIWDTVMTKFTTVREYYGRRS